MRQGDLFEDGTLVGAQCDPHGLQRLSRPDVAEILRALAAHAKQRAVDRADDVGQRDLLGRAGEPEAAIRSALTAYQARPAQLRQDRLKKLAGNPLRLGQLLRRHVPAARGGQLDRSAQRVVGAGGQTHIQHYAGNRLLLADAARQ